jgi:hypothetical protein
MVIGDVLQRFITHAPVCVMVRAVLEHQFAATQLDAVFARTAQRQYTKELAFSTCVQLLSQVTWGTAPSVHAAWKKARATVPASVVAVYAKLQHVEPAVCEALVQDTVDRLRPVLRRLTTPRTEPLPGYRVRVLDGNILAGTQRRLQVLRDSGAAALPGQTVVWYGYASGLIDALVACPDGHTNERQLFPQALTQVRAKDLVVGDRNYCTLDVLATLVQRRAAFLIRHHGSMHLTWLGPRRQAGTCRTGRVAQQQVRLSNGLVCRAIIVDRPTPLRGGGTQVILLTNVPPTHGSAARLATLYLERWTIEEAFRQLTEYLACEVRTLGYPQAALLGFTLAVLAYNTLACVRSALARARGRRKVATELSNYYLVEEVRSMYEGMRVAVPAADWQVFAQMTPEDLAQQLTCWAGQVDWSRYTKSPRGPKKPRKRRKVHRGSHVATARLLVHPRKSLKKAAGP